MQKNRIIANNISEEDLLNGHISIRFLPDGFSFLLSNRQHSPLLLYHYTGTGGASAAICRDELAGYGLHSGFRGESTILSGSLSATLIPETLFDPGQAAEMLDFTNHTPANETILAKKIQHRPWYLVFAIHPAIEKLASELGTRPRILHSAAAMISLADQIPASDHQRGFMLTEIQQDIMEVLIIREDKLLLSNRFSIRNNDEALYHLLNTVRQTGLDREQVPVYLAGEIADRSAFVSLLQRYVRKVREVPYTLQGADKATVQQFMLLTEANRCG